MEKLNLDEMQEVAGGKVCTKQEYCEILWTIFNGAVERGDLDNASSIAKAFNRNC